MLTWYVVTRGNRILCCRGPYTGLVTVLGGGAFTNNALLQIKKIGRGNEKAQGQITTVGVANLFMPEVGNLSLGYAT